jgi:preprotein translocase subunit YajC
LNGSAWSFIKPSPADLNIESVCRPVRMTTLDLHQGAFLAMATPGQGAAGLIQFLPFAIILGIFYFLILMPMKKRQKKVQEFQQALKVGDKIVTTSGIYGQITRLNDKSVQVQIADKVRIELSRAAVGGYQGQEPVVTENGNT